MTDARIVRTRAALHQAAASLASDRPASEITVSALAEAAGINRATFYKHFDTTTEVVASFLQEELDGIRERFIGAVGSSEDPIEVFRISVSSTLDHVERHIGIYRTAISTPHDGIVQNLLADHFTETMELYLQKRAAVEPPLPELDFSAVARFFAHGLTGAIKSWVLSGTGERETFTRTIVASAPDWWFPAAS